MHTAKERHVTERVKRAIEDCYEAARLIEDLIDLGQELALCERIIEETDEDRHPSVHAYYQYRRERVSRLALAIEDQLRELTRSWALA